MNKIAEAHYQRIFLLSHMRAYSSLTGHILGSHPQINGYYEMHLSYVSASDLDEQLRRYLRSESLKPGSLYLFDKLLHDDYALDPRILSGPGDRILVSLRAPESSLKSMLHLFQAKNTGDPYAEPVEATGYYIRRLKSLAEFCQENPGLYCYYDAELIKTDSHRLLQALTRWCQLGSPLSDSYRTFSLTGKAGAGDSSDLINSGKIQLAENRYPGVCLEAEHVRCAEQAYAECRAVMLANAKESLIL